MPSLSPRCLKPLRSGKPCLRKLDHPGQHQATCTTATTSAGRERARVRREWWRDLIDTYKCGVGCELCGFQNDRGGYFDLDHPERDGETHGKGVNYWARRLNPKKREHVEKFIAEIHKCQVLCVACHREKTGRDLAGDWV